MTKKLLKYGKILLALTLIGALTLPSYATVGAADGSAFVTKAEFDAALSDFNARLTTFEAGINSKIDSQVSSYLDRNGIWNGKAVVWSTTGSRTSGAGAVYTTSNSIGFNGTPTEVSLYEGRLIKSADVVKTGLYVGTAKQYSDFDGTTATNYPNMNDISLTQDSKEIFHIHWENGFNGPASDYVSAPWMFFISKGKQVNWSWKTWAGFEAKPYRLSFTYDSSPKIY